MIKTPKDSSKLVEGLGTSIPKKTTYFVSG